MQMTETYMHKDMPFTLM